MGTGSLHFDYNSLLYSTITMPTAILFMNPFTLSFGPGVYRQLQHRTCRAFSLSAVQDKTVLPCTILSRMTLTFMFAIHTSNHSRHALQPNHCYHWRDMPVWAMQPLWRCPSHEKEAQRVSWQSTAKKALEQRRGEEVGALRDQAGLLVGLPRSEPFYDHESTARSVLRPRAAGPQQKCFT